MKHLISLHIVREFQDVLITDKAKEETMGQMRKKVREAGVQYKEWREDAELATMTTLANVQATRTRPLPCPSDYYSLMQLLYMCLHQAAHDAVWQCLCAYYKCHSHIFPYPRKNDSVPGHGQESDGSSTMGHLCGCPGLF